MNGKSGSLHGCSGRSPRNCSRYFAQGVGPSDARERLQAVTRSNPPWFCPTALLVALAASVNLMGQAGSPAAPYSPPKTRFGQPDLQGIWQVLNTAAWDI